MKLIIGLGNPGDKYKYTRHNVGFLALDYLLKDKPTISCTSKFKSQICEVHMGGEKIFYVKPQTFMNLSGEAVSQILEYYKIDIAKDILIIHDEVDLPFGRIKTTNSSGAAGNNGIKSIIEHLGTQDFQRVRVGIETRKSRLQQPTDSFVLSTFTKEEQTELQEKVFPEIGTLVQTFLQQ